MKKNKGIRRMITERNKRKRKTNGKKQKREMQKGKNAIIRMQKRDKEKTWKKIRIGRCRKRVKNGK